MLFEQMTVYLPFLLQFEVQPSALSRLPPPWYCKLRLPLRLDLLHLIHEQIEHWWWSLVFVNLCRAEAGIQATSGAGENILVSLKSSDLSHVLSPKYPSESSEEFFPSSWQRKPPGRSQPRSQSWWCSAPFRRSCPPAGRGYTWIDNWVELFIFL